MYAKATETAIAAVSRLAEVYDGGQTKLSAAEIAQDRSLQRPFVGKVLSALSMAGIVTSSRGPGGGFSLARPPAEILLHDVADLFERVERDLRCPFGGGICGQGEKCPLHDRLADVRRAMGTLMHETSFDVFVRRSGDSRPRTDPQPRTKTSRTSRTRKPASRTKSARPKPPPR